MRPIIEADDCYPGTSQHQALLRSTVSHYRDDPRVLAVSVFGSLARGGWDRSSDLDLDIVVGDDVVIDPHSDAIALCESFASIGEHAALIIPNGDDAVDIVLSSLMGLSIRFHPLHNTSPNIVDSLRVLVRRIDKGQIEAAGAAHRSDSHTPLSQLLDRCVRYAVEVRLNLDRGRLWMAIELLHRMRLLVMELFARSHGGERPLHTFQDGANCAVQERLGATLPDYDIQSIEAAFVRFIDILETDLRFLTDGRVELTSAHRELLDRIRSMSGEKD